MKADCCSVKVQIIGFDPENDFVVKPWIAESLNRPLGDMEIVIGSRVATDVGEIFRIYDQRCLVAARLAATGTGLDTAVYCNMNTMHTLLRAAEEKGISHKIDTGNDAEVVSAIYVRTLPGADVTERSGRRPPSGPPVCSRKYRTAWAACPGRWRC